MAHRAEGFAIGPPLVLLGGTIQVTASSATPFTKLAVVIPELEDYWELTLPQATTSAAVGSDGFCRGSRPCL